jgi:HAD superfamily hydrolase (TIGR01509 family)
MLLIFDCDGVLVDSEVLACRIDAEVLTRLGIPYTADEIMAQFVGTSLKDMMARVEADRGCMLPPDFAAVLNRALFARFETDLKPIAGVREAILSLATPRCVASSSSPDRIALSLRVTELNDLFDHAFSASEVPRGKPAPDLFLHAAAQMGHPPDACVVIEDSLFGVQAARNAGMRVIGFTGGGHCADGHAALLERAGAHRIIDRMADMPAAILDLQPATASDPRLQLSTTAAIRAPWDR